MCIIVQQAVGCNLCQSEQDNDENALKDEEHSEMTSGNVFLDTNGLAYAGCLKRVSASKKLASEQLKTYIRRT